MSKIIQDSLMNSLKGAKIIKIFRTCDLICFNFKLINGKTIFLHLQCMLRVFDSNNTLVICSQNLLNRSPNYHKKWFKKYDWTCIGATVFDDAIKDYQDKLKESKILKSTFNRNDIEIMLENEMMINILVTTSKYDDLDFAEDYRIFDEDESKKHYIYPSTKTL